MIIVATMSLPAVDRWNADRWNAARSRQNTDENSGHYVIPSSRPLERRPLERRTLVPIMKKHKVESHEKYLDYNVLMHVKLSTEDFSEIKKKPYYYKDV